MKATPATQHALVSLAELDTTLAGLAHQRAHLPEQERLDQLQRERNTAAEAAARASIAVEDADRAIRKLRSDIDAVCRRIERDRNDLDAGQRPARELTELEHELATLNRRRGALEEEVADITARRDALHADVQHSGAVASDCDTRIAEATRLRDIAMADVDDAHDAATTEWQRLADSIPSALMAAYRDRVASGGVAAGLLSGRRCTACHMILDREFVATSAQAPEDQLLTCPECEAFLARTGTRS